MVSAGREATLSLGIVGALDRAWSAIRARHPDVPAVVITLAPGARSLTSRTFGHFSAGRWQAGGSTLAELFIASETLQCSSRWLLALMLHEAAHGVACTRDVQDTSRQARYHNDQYRAIAIELGLDVALDGPLGWNDTTLPDATAARYRTQLRRLDEVLVAWPRPGLTRSRPSNNNGMALRCDCGRRIRVSQKALSAGPIVCGVCWSEFAVPESATMAP